MSLMPQPNRELYGDMISLANSYAILRAAYCDAELWFRFGMVVNDSIGQVHLDSVWDLEARNADSCRYSSKRYNSLGSV